MNCKYCNKEAEYKPIERVEAAKGKIYWCESCSCEIINWERSKRISYSLYTTVNGRMFRWTTTDEEPPFASLWRIGKPGIVGVLMNEDVKCIATFGDISTTQSIGVSEVIPEITPQNIQDKLSKYLPFL